MSDSFIPESDNTEKFIFFVLVLLGIVIIFLESTGNNIPYSKFELKNERVNIYMYYTFIFILFYIYIYICVFFFFLYIYL